MNFVLIDGSYFIFYRYYALCVWYKHAKMPDDPERPCDCEKFIQRFESTFVDKINELDKQLGLQNSIKYVGKDCPKSSIWRNTFIDEYKAGRKNNDDIKTLFKKAYKNNENEQNQNGLFIDAGCKKVLEYPALEADDCIAITAKHIREKYPESKIWIITSDMDYLQLASHHITLVDLKFKNLTQSKSSFQDADKDLFCKIVAGDKSDNIPSVIPRCGMKTAEKYYNNRELFNAKIKEHNANDAFERNQRIIDFNYIPKNLSDGFKYELINTFDI